MTCDARRVLVLMVARDRVPAPGGKVLYADSSFKVAHLRCRLASMKAATTNRLRPFVTRRPTPERPETEEAMHVPGKAIRRWTTAWQFALLSMTGAVSSLTHRRSPHPCSIRGRGAHAPTVPFAVPPRRRRDDDRTRPFRHELLRRTQSQGRQCSDRPPCYPVRPTRHSAAGTSTRLTVVARR